MKGILVTKGFCDEDLIAIWENGFLKKRETLRGFAQYRLASGSTRLIYTLKQEVHLENFVNDPLFQFVKDIRGNSYSYDCKVLDLRKIPLAEIGSEVTIFVRHTHLEVSRKQIDAWIRIYADILFESR